MVFNLVRLFYMISITLQDELTVATFQGSLDNKPTHNTLNSNSFGALTLS